MGIYLFSKQKTAYEMRISDWSSDVCSSDLAYSRADRSLNHSLIRDHRIFEMGRERDRHILHGDPAHGTTQRSKTLFGDDSGKFTCGAARSEEHTSELQSLMRISYAVFCLKKKKIQQSENKHNSKNKKKETTHDKI